MFVGRGMLNVHASLLPRWRGAAPIIHALMHGDAVTGVSIMRIKPNKFDIGDIVKQESCHIHRDETLPQLYGRLAALGAKVLVECLHDLPHCLTKAVPQPHGNSTYAPKVQPAVARVRWRDMTCQQVYNLHRAVASIHPLTTSWHGLPVRLHHASPSTDCAAGERPGCVQYVPSSNVLRVACADQLFIHFQAVGLPNKKPLTAAEFHNGYLSKKKHSDRIFD
ncbi:methionyl-tRNA formyltransferase, mitochondrial isoform X5 [Bacillus rossius redtenbacheri]|uniref:methionyl-tRNA formyltransferase, mitochondrial isoform X5 n=1 Tax=Bacillus rossius redtenbacheri TaxID=93214 RepID=UPI002FDD8E64